MGVSPDVDDVDDRKKFHILSSMVCFGVYSTLLATLLGVFNTQTYTEEKWENVYLNPSIPGHLMKLNFLTLSLIVSGIFSIIGYWIVFRFRSCVKIVEKVNIG